MDGFSVRCLAGRRALVTLRNSHPGDTPHKHVLCIDVLRLSLPLASGPSRFLQVLQVPRGTARWCTSGARGSSRPRRKKNAATGRANRKIRGSNTAVKTLAPTELPTPSYCALNCKRCSLDLSRTAEGRGTEHGYSSLSMYPMIG